MTPDVSPAQTRVLLAIVRRYELGLPLGYGQLMHDVGLRSTSSLHDQLHRLRAKGLVAFEDGTLGTLRPLVERASFGRP